MCERVCARVASRHVPVADSGASVRGVRVRVRGAAAAGLRSEAVRERVHPRRHLYLRGLALETSHRPGATWRR